MSSAQVADAVIAIVVVCWVMVRQVQPRPVVVRKMVVLPLILFLIGLEGVTHAVPKGHSFTSTDATWLAIDLAVAVVSGLVRAFTVRLYDQGGELWRQGTAVTVALWLASIAARIVIAVAGGHAGAGKVLDSGLMMSFGLSLAVQYGVIAWRGVQTGIPFAARDRVERP